MKPFSDIQCITSILNGNKQLYSVLVNRYKDLVYTAVVRLVKNNEVAEEVAQDTFIKAYNALNKFKGDAKFSTWLYRIAYNSSLDYLKKKKLNIEPISKLNEMDVVSSLDVLNEIEKVERNTIIKRCIEQLNGDDSFLLTLYYYEELSIVELANVLDLTLSNTKQKLFRARKKLAVLLKENLEKEWIEVYERN